MTISEPAMTMAELEDAVVEVVRQDNRACSFVNLRDFLADKIEVEGSFALCAPERPNTVFWAGMSEEFCDLMVPLLRQRRIHLWPTSPLVYLVDGCLLRLPIAKRPSRHRDYKEEHWLPTVLSVDPLP